MQRRFNLAPNTTITACPECGNNTAFTAHSEQCAEDSCDVWVVCQCGYDPTAYLPLHRVEDVWGTLDAGTIRAALDCWNEAIVELAKKAEKASA